MRRFLPFLVVLLFLPVLVRGQVSISVDPTSFVINGNPSQTDIYYYVYVTNTSDHTVNLFWSKRMSGNPMGWFSWICDSNLCFDPSVNACPSNKPNILAPGDTMNVQVHMNPSNMEGTATYELNILDEGGNILATVDGEILISSTTSVKENSSANLTVFPNPTTDYFQVSGISGLKFIELFNIVGNKVRTYDALPQKQYTVGDLTDGIYLVRLMTSSGKIIKTIRLSKR